MTQRGKKSRRGVRILVALVVLALVVGYVGWYKLLRQVPQELQDDSLEEYFKYGSIGTEERMGIPFWIWLVLPQMFPEYLPGPGGYASLGFAWEQGRETPVGFSKRTIGFERIGVNCALCHTATVRKTPDEVPTIYPGGPGPTVDILSYQRFLFACASDPRFNARNILHAIGEVKRLPLLDRLLYRFVLIPLTKRTLLQQKEEWAWTEVRPVWGRGRIDPFNPVKVSLLQVPVGETIGNSDMMPIWNLRPREGMAYHWDGLNTDLTEVVLSSALGDGATPKSLPLEKLQELQDWLLDLEPPKYPFPVDSDLAASGEGIYREHCASCHAFGGERTGQVLPVAEAGTDPHRAEMWTPEAAEAYNAYAAKYPWKFNHFRSTGGYVNVPLDAVWIRAPYLHNGSVPNLVDLLEPPERRPQVFYRGYDVYDPEGVGFVSEGPEAERFGFRYDTGLPGNGNGGHLWGTDLSSEEKRALIEYLKTL